MWSALGSLRASEGANTVVTTMEQLKVSTRSNPNSVAGAMAGAVRQSGAVEVQVVGAGALNQAIKAVAIARGYVAAAGIDLVCVPTFADIDIDGERRTAIRLTVEDRASRSAPVPAEIEAVELNGHDPGHRAAEVPAPAG
jgi:stage V sporulation protein S